MCGSNTVASKLLVCVGLCFLAAGCSHPLVWVNPGASETNFAEADRVCAIQSQQGEAYMNGSAGPARPGSAANSAAFDHCMNFMGWHLRRVSNGS
jgi:hypothetical protein